MKYSLVSLYFIIHCILLTEQLKLNFYRSSEIYEGTEQRYAVAYLLRYIIQAVWWRFRFPMGSLGFFVDLFLSAALWHLGSTDPSNVNEY